MSYRVFRNVERCQQRPFHCEVFLTMTKIFLTLTEVFLTLTEVFLCFFLSCKQMPDELAKT